MIEALSVVALGLVLGVQHATDADHVVAVATIVSRTRRFASGALIGALWGLGHTATIATVGAAIILLGVQIGPRLGLAMEMAVAVMLVGLGAARLATVLRGADAVPVEHLTDTALHPRAPGGGPLRASAPHRHGGVEHRHGVVTPSARLARALAGVGRGQALRSIGVGLVHGLAGSAAVALLVLSTIASPRAAVLYLLLFGLGTILGMTGITALLSLPLASRRLAVPRLRQAFGFGAGLVSIGLGLYLVFQIGVVDGVLVGIPHWAPR